MDNVNTHKNEAQEKTPKINFVQKFFRKLIGYQEPTSYEEIQKMITKRINKDKLGREIDYYELSSHIEYDMIADYVDNYYIAQELDKYEIGENIDIDYHQIIGNLDYEDLFSGILDKDLKTGIKSLEKELLTIENLFDAFYQTLSNVTQEFKIVKER